MQAADVIQSLRSAFGEAIEQESEFRGDWTVTVRRERIVDICRHLKAQCGFAMLTDLSGVDHYPEEPRFEVHYTVYSFQHRFWFHVRTFLPESDATIDSVVGVWKTADWHEREAYDMYGITFRHHPNLTRILMWEGYPHYPLRKDFPLSGLPADLPVTAQGVGRAESAPMLGGPFVPGTGTGRSLRREPRQYDTLAEKAEKQARPDRQEEV